MPGYHVTHPTIMVSAAVCHNAYEQMGLQLGHLSNSTKAVDIPGKADTGASVCVAGTNLLREIGAHDTSLVQVRTAAFTCWVAYFCAYRQ